MSNSALVDLPAVQGGIGAMAQGAQAFPFAMSLTATTPITGAVTLTTRPTSVSSVPVPAQAQTFLAKPLTNFTGGVTLTLPVATGNYVAGDVVRVLLTVTTMNSNTCAIVDGGAGAPTLVVMPVTIANQAYVDCQLNAAGTHWTIIEAGGC